jgi:hypothetical protein
MTRTITDRHQSAACRLDTRACKILLLTAVLGGCAALPPEPIGAPRPPAETRADTRRDAPPMEGAAESVEPRPSSRAGDSADDGRARSGAGDSDRLGSADVDGVPPVSLALLAQSRSERAAGSYAAAASSIERALRIDPNDATLWLELGEIKLADRDPAQAQMMARKALTLAGGDRVIASRAQRLIDSAACASGAC